MKPLKLFFILLITCTLSLTLSCKKSNPVTPVVNTTNMAGNPTIQLNTDKTTLAPGENVTFSMVLHGSSQLKEVKITSGILLLRDTLISGTDISLSYKWKTPSNLQGSISIAVTVFDVSGRSASQSITLNFLGNTASNPSISLTPANMTVTPGQLVKLTISAASDATNSVNITSVELFQIVAGSAVSLKKFTYTGTKTATVDTFTVMIYPNAKNGDIYTFSAIVTDSKAVTGTCSTTFTVVANSLSAPATATLGDLNNNTLGSFLSFADGSVKSESTIAATPSIADLAYYYNSTDGSALGAPNDSKVQAVFTHIAGISGLKTTKLKKAANVTSYDNATFTSVATDCASTTNTIVTGINSGDVILFMTDGGKYGVLKVNSISTVTGTGTINISYKIQQ